MIFFRVERRIRLSNFIYLKFKLAYLLDINTYTPYSQLVQITSLQKLYYMNSLVFILRAPLGCPQFFCSKIVDLRLLQTPIIPKLRQEKLTKNLLGIILYIKRNFSDFGRGVIGDYRFNEGESDKNTA